MPKISVCDNPHCECQFHTDPVVVYCGDCEGLAADWERIKKEQVEINADAFHDAMTSARDKFFAAKTPKNRKGKPTPPKDAIGK